MSWAMLAYADLSELDLRWVSLSTAHLQGAKGLNKRKSQ